MLETAVFSLGVLSDCYQVHVFVGCVHALDGLAWADVSEEVQAFSKGDIEGSEAFAYWGLEWTFQAVLVALDCLDAFVGNQVALLSLTLRVDLMWLKVNRHLQGMEDVLHTPSDLRPDTIARKQHNLMLVSLSLIHI